MRLAVLFLLLLTTQVVAEEKMTIDELDRQRALLVQQERDAKAASIDPHTVSIQQIITTMQGDDGVNLEFHAGDPGFDEIVAAIKAAAAARLNKE